MTLPSGIANLGLWLRGDDIAQADASAVASWADAVSGITFTAAGGAQPTYRTNRLNGHAAVVFDGTTDALSGGAAAKALLNGKPGATIFIVNADPGTNAGAFQELLYFATPSAGSARVRFTHDGAHARNVAVRRLDADGISTISGSVADTDAHIETATIDFANTDLLLHVDGTLDASNTSFSATGSFSATDSATVTIGDADTGGGEAWTGDIYEILVYTRPLTASERADVHTYLQNKYGVAVSDYVASTGSTGVLPLVAELNRLAGTTGLGEAAAANVYAGTTGLETVAALNHKAGNAVGSYREINGVCNQLAGTTGLEAPAALARL